MITLSNFVNILYTKIGKGADKSDFLLLLTESFMENPLSADKTKPNPLEGLSSDMLSRIFNGTRNLSKRNAGKILANMDKRNFVNFISSFTNDAIDAIGKELEKSGVAIIEDDVLETCANIFETILNSLVTGIKTNEDENSVGRLNLLEKLKDEGHYELLTDLENIHKQQDTLDKLVNLLERYNCIAPYPHAIHKYMKELKEFFTTAEFNDSKITSAVKDFHLTHDEFQCYLMTYYERLRQIGKNEEGEQNEKVIIENIEKLPKEMKSRQALFHLSLRTLVKLECELETVAIALLSVKNKD